jgi:DNA-binding protein H-NS
MSKLNAEALRARIAQLQKQLAAAEISKAPAIKKVKALMKKLGVTIEDLADEKTKGRRGRPPKAQTEGSAQKTKVKKSRGTVAIKYRDDKGNTWTGRGKTPRWLVEAEKVGKTRDSFRI